MKNALEYIKLMNGESCVMSPPMSFTTYDKANNVTLLPDGQYSFLFILRGKVCCEFNNSRNIIEEGHLFVIDKNKIQTCTCSEGSIILEYETIGKMSNIMRSILYVFKKNCSDIVPINDKIHKWCKSLLKRHMSKEIKTSGYDREECVLLTTLLLEYPQEILGTLFIPLRACKIGCINEKECLLKAQ